MTPKLGPTLNVPSAEIRCMVFAEGWIVARPVAKAHPRDDDG